MGFALLTEDHFKTATVGNKLAHDAGSGACFQDIHSKKLQAAYGAQRHFIGKKGFLVGGFQPRSSRLESRSHRK